MDSERRNRAAIGITLVTLAGLGLLIFARSRSPQEPVFFDFAPVTPLPEATSMLLFDAPDTLWATPPDSAPSADIASAIYLLYIPRLDLFAPVVPIENEMQVIGGQEVWQLSLPPEFAVGWSTASAPVGKAGNTVFVGHNNEYGEVFRGLGELSEGDEVYVRSEAGDRRYRVSQTALFEEEYLSLDERLVNAEWLAPTPDERLTLITCWPYFSNTHRLVVVAQPG